MFDKELIEAYKKITAPDTLREKVMNTAARDSVAAKNTFYSRMKKLAAVAACFIVVSIAAISLNRQNDLSLTVVKTNGVRAVNEVSEAIVKYHIPPYGELVITIDLKTKSETVVTVTHGLVMAEGESEFDDSCKASTNTRIFWSVEQMPETEYAFITITTNKNTKTYRLNYNFQSDKWSLKKIKR